MTNKFALLDILEIAKAGRFAHHIMDESAATR